MKKNKGIAMRLTIEPTEVMRLVHGLICREWRGTDDQGVEVVALIRGVAPQTNDEAVAKRYAAELLAVGEPVTAPPIDFRFVG
jgi:hypothetical protein